MSIKALIHTLNHLTIGEITALTYRVQECRNEALGLGLTQISSILDEALEHLEHADIKLFRKRIAHAVSRLGHVRDVADPVETLGESAQGLRK